MPFEDFVAAVASIPDEHADVHFRSQHTFITDRFCRVAIDFVGRYESLNKDIKQIQQQLALAEFELPRLQASRVKINYAGYYTTKTKEVVAQRFEKDIDLFEYKFDS